MIRTRVFLAVVAGLAPACGRLREIQEAHSGWFQELDRADGGWRNRSPTS